MRGTLAIVACLLLLCTASATQSTKLPTKIRNGHYSARSGNVLLAPASTDRDMVAMFVDKSGHNYFGKSHQEVFSVFNVADVVTRSLGLSPVNAAYTPDFVKSDLFDRPQANVLLTVDGLGANVVERLGLQQIKRIGAASTASLVYNSYPFSAVSLAASVASGQPASTHGIVGSSWNQQNGQVEAYSAQGYALAHNAADILAESFPQSLIVSASGSRQLAAAHCPQTVTNTHHCVSLKDRDFAPISGGDSALATSGAAVRRAILENDSVFSALPASAGVTVATKTDGTVTVTHNGQAATFDLHNSADYALFAELQYLAALPDQLAGDLSARTGDAYPDLYTLTVSSLPAIAAAKGAFSAEYAAAAALVDAVVPVLLERLSAVYNGRIVSEVLLLGSPEVDTQAQLSAAGPVARSIVPTVSLAYLPNLYVEGTMDQITTACDKLQSSVNAEETQVFCFPEARSAPAFQSLGARFTVQATPSLQASNTTWAQTTAIHKYQIALWFSVFLAIILLYVVYSSAFMQFKKDTLLYGTFNPHWEDRKKH